VRNTDHPWERAPIFPELHEGVANCTYGWLIGNRDRGLGTGDWGLGTGDWGLGRQGE